MKSATILIGILLALVSMKPVQQDPTGIWLTEGGEMKVEIYQKGGQYFGKLVWLEEPNDEQGNAKKDLHNPDRSLRERPLMGIDVLRNLKADGDHYSGGFYAPKRGIEADAQVKITPDGKLALKVTYRGFSREQTWTKTGL